MHNFQELAKISKKINSFSCHPGIYMYICNPSGVVYIGSTVDVWRRYKEHRRDLRGKRHHTPKLQDAWNKYGQDQFSFYCLEKIPPNKANQKFLLERENYYLTANSRDEYFNTEIPANSCYGKNRTKREFKISEEQKYQISKTLYGRPLGKQVLDQRIAIGQANAIKMGFQPMTYEAADILKKEFKEKHPLYPRGPKKQGVEKTMEELAKKYNFSFTVVSNVVRGRHWTNPDFGGSRKHNFVPKFKKMEIAQENEKKKSLSED